MVGLIQSWPRESGHREVEEKPQEGEEKRRKGSPSRGLRPEGERVKERRDASRTRKKRSSGHGHTLSPSVSATSLVG